METEEKREIETGQLVRHDWRKLLIRWVVILALTAVLYRIGAALGLWVRFYAAARIDQVLVGLVLCWVGAIFLYNFYGRLMARLLVRPLMEGINHLQNNDYEAALASFRQLYDYFDQHPWKEKLYPFLMLETSRDSIREIALFNQALVHGRLGNDLERVRCYEQLLDLNPENELAISSLNFIAAVTGGEVRPMPRHIPFQAFTVSSPKSQPWWQRWVPLALFVLFLFGCMVPAVAVLALLLKSLNGEALLPFIYYGVFPLPFILWAAARLISRQALVDFHRGEKFYRKRRYREGIQAFEKQAAFLQENPWIDKWRWLFLPRSGLYSYQEWCLIRMADGYEALNEGDRLLPIYEQILALNPDNGTAILSIRFIKKYRKEDGTILALGQNDREDDENRG